MVLVSLPLHCVNGLMFHDYWELVMALRPFLGARRDVLLDLQAVSDDCDVSRDCANKLIGI